MEVRIETIILQNLIHNDNFTRKVIPYLKHDYFLEEHKICFKHIVNYVAKYNTLPTEQALKISIDESKIDKHEKELSLKLIENIFRKIPENQNEDWLVDETEKWVKERAITIALIDSFEIVTGKNKKTSKGAIPEKLQKALNVSFDNSVGHDYFLDTQERYDFYTGKSSDIIKIPFGLSKFNEATNGGYETKSLNVIIGATGGGKTLSLCSHCADALAQGEDCLYITAELAGLKIAHRIDANLMNLPLDSFGFLQKEDFNKEVDKIEQKTRGRLIVKEYPAVSVSVNDIRALLEELKIKKNFTPKVIFVDYLNNLLSARYKPDNSYGYIKGIAEELRGLAMEQNLAIWSATQLNRDGLKSSEPEPTDIAESIGLTYVVDFMFIIYADENLRMMNKMKIKQALKNRYADIDKLPEFMVGCERSKMKLYDLEE